MQVDNSRLENSTVDKSIAELEELAAAILSRKKTVSPRRPIVIEFCGSPKAGKTSCINSLSIFLRRNGFRIKTLTERASVCPIPNKFDPNFNVWTASTALANVIDLLSNSSRDLDVVILDRGLFDSACWFYWQFQERKLDKPHYDRFMEFFLTERWMSKIDIVYILTATPEVSLQREYANLLTRKEGSVMRKPVLATFNESIKHCQQSFAPRVKKIESFDTTELDQNTVGYRVTSSILQILDNLFLEHIGYFDAATLGGFKAGIFPFQRLLDAKPTLSFDSRHEVETRGDALQPIPVAVITDRNRNRILAGRKMRSATAENSAERGKSLVYFGGHIRSDDTLFDLPFAEIIQTAMRRELKEELDLDYVPDLTHAFCIWDKSNERSRKHLCIGTVAELDLDNLSIRADRNEFADMSFSIFSRDDFLRSKPRLESWGDMILRDVLKWKGPGLL